ncbi:interleukin 17-like protein [Argonauta hians]
MAYLYMLIILFNTVVMVSNSPIPQECKIPSDLKVQYNKLYNAAIGNKFFLPAEFAPPIKNQTLTDGDTSCPEKVNPIDDIRERSTCPWYVKIYHDSRYFPQSRTEVVCRCDKCLGLNDGNHQCVGVSTNMLVLERTNKCVDGLYVYQKKMINVTTACVCAHKVDVTSGGMDDYAE